MILIGAGSVGNRVLMFEREAPTQRSSAAARFTIQSGPDTRVARVGSFGSAHPKVWFRPVKILNRMTELGRPHFERTA